MRACAVNRDALGCSEYGDADGDAVFALSGMLGGLAGAIVAPISAGIRYGNMLGLKGFAAAILGGMGNPSRSLGRLVVGNLESLGAGLSLRMVRFKDAIAFGIMLAVLLLKPSGLLGRARSSVKSAQKAQQAIPAESNPTQ